MTKLPQFVRSRLALRQTASDEHPDADLLAAFAAKTMSSHARGDLLEHLARCPECREVLAAASVSQVDKTPRIAWWKWRWAAAAAAACLVAALLWRPDSVENARLQIILPAPSAPPTLKEAVRPKATIDKPGIVPPRRPSVHSKQPVAEAKPELALRQTAALPPQKLNLGVPEPPPALPKTASLEVREANNASLQLSRREQPERSAQSQAAPMGPKAMFQSGAPASVTKNRARQAMQFEGEKSLWNLDGVLRKSDDGGRTWRVIEVSDSARLYALSAAGSDVWVGGADGVLFHSVNNGLDWKPVVVANTNARLTDTITGIDTRDANRVKLKTQSGDWLTTDGGLHWQPQ